MDLCQVFLSLSFARSLHRWWYVSDGSCGVLTLWGSLHESFVWLAVCICTASSWMLLSYWTPGMGACSFVGGEC